MKMRGSGGYREALGGRVRGFRFAFAGIRYVLDEPSFRVQLAIAFIVLIAAALLRVQPAEWLALILVSLAVLLMEMLNTAIEAVVDLASPQYDPLAKTAKDVAAGAVLVAVTGAVLVGAYIFLPHLARLAGMG